MNKKIRVRFAPSPTGSLHVGNARTALFNWLFARKFNGSFILRIDDTDVKRSESVHEKVVCDNLKWLGIDWDEGPDTPNAMFGPYRQSERLDMYKHFVKVLTEKGVIYPCYCSEEELKAERNKMRTQKIAPRYSGKCRHLSNSDRTKLESEGRKPALRFAVPSELKKITINDLIHGKISFSTSLIGDFIVVRSNGMPPYNFASVIDDVLMKISHIIRGEDHLSNTPRQILIYKALGIEIPCFAHHALLLGLDRTKLSKRHGVTAVSAFMKRGFIPEALNNYMAWLGGGFGIDNEIYSTVNLIGHFSLRKIGKNASIFDESKLRWMNSKHLREMSIDRIITLWRQFDDNFSEDYLDSVKKIIPFVIDNAETLEQLKDICAVFIEEDAPLSEEAKTLLLSDDSKHVLNALNDCLDNAQDTFDKNDFDALIKQIQKTTGAKGRGLYMPIRAALTGMLHGPELDKLFLNVKSSVLRNRIKKALEINL